MDTRLCIALALLLSFGGDVWKTSGDRWRTDRAWHDGQAEKAIYRATRVIYGKPRAYEAIAYTNKERYDPRTTTKSESNDGLEVFKHHWSEMAPTENYTYRFSTSLYTAVDSLEAIKLAVSTQEDCGASFKQIWREGERLRWWDSVYFPGAGTREGALDGARGVHFVDELPLLLRDFPFEKAEPIALTLVASQKDTHQVSFAPFAASVRWIGRETRDLPIGKTAAHHLRLEGGGTSADYWFAADGSAPMLHALVEYADPSGTRYQLASLIRTAYWKR